MTRNKYQINEAEIERGEWLKGFNGDAEYNLNPM